ncbi:unnamed protein product [Camellia sinensis]
MIFDALINTKIELSSCMKYDDVIAKIIETYNPASNSFKIGPKSVKLSTYDVKLIFRIDCGSVPMEIASGSKPTFNLDLLARSARTHRGLHRKISDLRSMTHWLGERNQIIRRLLD